MARNLTIHLAQEFPYSNLNRDDAGSPKRILQGGVLRAMLSSQAIKRGIRTIYENQSMDLSVRSGRLADEVAAAALELDGSLDKKKTEKEAAKIIGQLTKGGESEGGSDRSAWLSSEELATAAKTVADRVGGGATDKVDASAYMTEGATGSLAIAAFGRMFANSPEFGTEAALSVSPAVTTHQAVIEADYFSTVDDVKVRERESGATFLGTTQFTSGVFYRAITIDRDQLKESWSGWDLPGADEKLGLLVDAILYGLPRGKEHSTAPYVQPALVLAEEQKYRVAYGFDTPVEAASDGGYLAPTVSELARQYAAARRFDPDNFGELSLVTGTYEGLANEFTGTSVVTKRELIDAVVRWIRSE